VSIICDCNCEGIVPWRVNDQQAWQLHVKCAVATQLGVEERNGLWRE
jgi:hypothetical protein